MIDSHFHLWTEDSSTATKREDRAEQVREMADAAGVDRICLIGDLGDDVEECREHNRTVASYCEEYPDLFFAWARANPRWGEDGVTEFRRAVEEDGLVGLKNHFGPGNLWGSDMKVSDERFFPMAEAAADMDVPIIVHVCQREDPFPEEWPTESYTEDVVELAESFPDLDIISAHIGGGGDWEYRIKNIRDYPNIYLDTSGSVTDAGMLAMAADELGADRLVFGTDTWFVPGVGKLLGADLTPDQKATIAYKMHDLLAESTANRIPADELAEHREAARERFAGLGPREEPIADANAFVGQFPFRQIDGEPQQVAQRLDDAGVDRAFVSAAESLFYRNVHRGNVELAERLPDDDRFVPVATIDPTYPAWEDDLDQCVEEFGMAAVKLLPAHHDYDPDAPEAKELLRACADRDVPAILAAAVEDQRQRHPRVRLRDFDGMRSKWWSDEQADAVIELLADAPETDVVVADAWAHANRIKQSVCETTRDGVWLNNFEREGETYFVLDDLFVFFPYQAAEIAEEIGPDHLVCGPRLPFRVFEAHYANLEQMPVDEEAKAKIRYDNLLSLVE